MSTTIERDGGEAVAPPRPTIAGQPVDLERPSARKASRALAILRALSKAVPDVQKAWARARTDYERDNFVELDRVQARMRYPARPLLDDDGKPILKDDGELTFLPSPVDAMSDADWDAAGGVFRMPQSPTVGEQAAAVLDLALELAEEHVYRLLALFTMSNADVTRHWRAGDLGAVIDDVADDILDRAYADEVLELAVACGEIVDDQFTTRIEALGDRLGNLGRLFGWTPTAKPTAEEATSTDSPSSSRPTSSTDSPAPADTDGPSTPSSTSPGSSSSSSPNGSTPTTPLAERPTDEE